MAHWICPHVGTFDVSCEQDINYNASYNISKCSLHKGATLMQILPLCYLHLVTASRSYRLVPKMVLTLQLALVVFFRPSTSANTPLGGHCPLQLALVVFFLGALAH